MQHLSIPFVGFIEDFKKAKEDIQVIFQFPLLGSVETPEASLLEALYFQFPLLGSEEELEREGLNWIIFQFPLLGSTAWH